MNKPPLSDEEFLVGLLQRPLFWVNCCVAALFFAVLFFGLPDLGGDPPAEASSDSLSQTTEADHDRN